MSIASKDPVPVRVIVALEPIVSKSIVSVVNALPMQYLKLPEVPDPNAVSSVVLTIHAVE